MRFGRQLSDPTLSSQFVSVPGVLRNHNEKIDIAVKVRCPLYSMCAIASSMCLTRKLHFLGGTDRFLEDLVFQLRIQRIGHDQIYVVNSQNGLEVLFDPHEVEQPHGRSNSTSISTSLLLVGSPRATDPNSANDLTLMRRSDGLSTESFSRICCRSIGVRPITQASIPRPLHNANDGE